MKVGRNDPCPCGSGKKYKKCCSPKYDQPVAQAVKPFEDFESFAARAWTAEKLSAMGESEIVTKLNQLGIRTDKEHFAEEVGGSFSVDAIVEKWTKRLRTVDVLDEDFIVFAAKELWNRWLPDKFSLHRLEAMMEDYLDHDPGERVLERYEAIWSALRDHYIIPYNCRSFEEFTGKTDFPYDMDAVFFDTEGDMVNECRERQQDDPECWDRLIRLYREMLEYFTNMDEDNRLNLRRSYAEAYFYKGDAAAGSALYRQLVDERPDWAWGYVGWGDMYNPHFADPGMSDPSEAMRLYRWGLEKASADKDVLEERIKDLETP